MLGKRLRHLERFRFCTFVAPLIKETIVKVNEKRHTGGHKLTAMTTTTMMKTSRVTDRTDGRALK